MNVKVISPPLDDEAVLDLEAGDSVVITGRLLTARDAAHRRLAQLIEAGEPLPVDLEGQVIYYVGPSPAKPGRTIGSAGPTTSGRMDAYAPLLLERGLKGMIGKGARSQAVRDSIRENRAVYFAAVGGAAALLARRIRAARIVAYEDLGPEAIRELQVEEFPVLVVNDAHGGDLYESGRREFEEEGA